MMVAKRNLDRGAIFKHLLFLDCQNEENNNC